MSTQPRLHDLGEIEAAVWRELAGAVRDKAHAWRVAVLATTDGVQADARSVILRDVDAAARTLLIYTDARSPKAQQLAAHPLGTLVLWSPALAWQLRLRVALSLHTTGLQVTSRWARIKLTPAAQDYMAAQAPGAPLDAPPLATEGRAHFAVVVAQVQSIDWLELKPSGHRRAVFGGAGGCWVAP